MAYRVLEVTLLSAKDLKNVNLFTRMEVYAVATISGDPMTRQCTPPDPDGGRNPTWNATLRFNVPPTAEEAKGGCLHIVLLAERTFGADREVGEVIVPLAEVLTGGGLGAPNMPQFASYQVRKLHRTETRGLLYLTYRLGPIVVPPHAKSVVGYPAQQEMPSSPSKLPGPSTPKPSGYTTAPPNPSPKPTVQVVCMPPSSKPPGYATVQVGSMPPSQKPAERAVSMPPSPSPTPAGHEVSMPPSSKPTGQVVSMPPSQKPSRQLVSMRSFPKPDQHIVSMPPSQQPGHAVSMPPSPKPAEHVVSMPPSPKPAGGHDVDMLSSPKPSVHAVPPSPKSDKHMDVPPSRKPADGHTAMLSSPKPFGERIFTTTDIYRVPLRNEDPSTRRYPSTG